MKNFTNIFSKCTCDASWVPIYYPNYARFLVKINFNPETFRIIKYIRCVSLNVIWYTAINLNSYSTWLFFRIRMLKVIVVGNDKPPFLSIFVSLTATNTIHGGFCMNDSMLDSLSIFFLKLLIFVWKMQMSSGFLFAIIELKELISW